MRNGWLICFLFGVIAWGQDKPALVPQQKTPALTADEDDKPVPIPAAAAAVPLDAPVLTIKGLCPEDSSKVQAASKNCQTVITRAGLEKIARAIQPNMTPTVKRQLVSLYPRLLIMSHEAEVRGLDKEEYFQQMLAFARMQILTQQLTHSVQEEARKVPEQEIADYYQKNPDSFTEYGLERIFVPRMKQEPPPAAKLSEEAEKKRGKDSEDAMTKIADDLRARAVKGESFAALQKEAYQLAGLKSNPPNASMGKLRRTGVPPGHDSVFSLKIGEVSPVLSDSGGHYIYKIDSKSKETLDDAKAEIHNLLQSQRMKEFMEKIQGPFTTDVNEAYFETGAHAEGPNAPNTGVAQPGMGATPRDQ